MCRCWGRNNSYALFTNKATHCTVETKAVNDLCANMAFNAGKEDALASSHLVKAKRHSQLVVPRRQRRAPFGPWQVKATRRRFRNDAELVEKKLEEKAESLVKRTERREATVKTLDAQRDAELAALTPGERRWEGHIRDMTERKLRFCYDRQLGAHYGPSGGLQTAKGKLFLPWPLPRRTLDFPRTLAAAADRAAAQTSSDEEDPPADASAGASGQADESVRSPLPGPSRLLSLTITLSGLAAPSTAAELRTVLFRMTRWRKSWTSGQATTARSTSCAGVGMAKRRTPGSRRPTSTVAGA